MVATIDSNSIVVMPTSDPLVFVVDFEFTDDVVDVNQGWLATWIHVSMLYNTNMTNTEWNGIRNAAIQAARRSTSAAAVQTDIRTKNGTVVNRTMTAATPNNGQSADYPMYVRVVT